MKSTIIIASAIIAAAIGGSSVLLSYSTAQAEANRLNAFFSFLERAANQKDSSGETQLQALSSGVVRSISKGFESGFNRPSDKDKKKLDEYLEDISALPLSDVQLVADGNTSEKVIGLVTNNTQKPISDIKLNVIYRNQDGGLIDVASSFTSIDGNLLPGKQFGFAIDRRYGNSSDSDSDLAAKKAASVDVSIASLRTSL